MLLTLRISSSIHVKAENFLSHNVVMSLKASSTYTDSSRRGRVDTSGTAELVRCIQFLLPFHHTQKLNMKLLRNRPIVIILLMCVQPCVTIAFCDEFGFKIGCDFSSHHHSSMANRSALVNFIIFLRHLHATLMKTSIVSE
jgi:hypothetical protein